MVISVLGALALVQAAIIGRLLWGRTRRTDQPISRDTFMTMFGLAPANYILCDEAGQVVAANPAMCEFFGREESEITGRTGETVSHHEDGAGYRHAEEILSAPPGAVLRLEKRYVLPGGAIRWGLVTASRIYGPDNRSWLLAHVQDITETYESQEALRDSESTRAAVAAVVRAIRTGADARETIVAAALDLTEASTVALLEPADEWSLGVTASVGFNLGVSLTQMTEPHLIDLAVPHTTGLAWHSAEARFIEHLVDDPAWNEPELEMYRSHSYLVQPIISRGKVTALLAVTWENSFSTVPSRIEFVMRMLAEETAVVLEHDLLLGHLARLATTDSLTNAPNRRAWDERLPTLLASADRSDKPLVVAILDLDHFKVFNDHFGHSRGDELLAELALRLKKSLRQTGFYARWGGEEFAVALPDCSLEDAEQVLSRLQGLVPDDQTCSIGYAAWNGSESMTQLVNRADQALYRAKATGRNSVCRAPDALPVQQLDTQPAFRVGTAPTQLATEV